MTDQPAVLSFDNLTTQEVAASFKVDAATRTIEGIAIPYGDVASSMGEKWSFGPGTLSWEYAKSLVSHDWGQLLGVATFTDTDKALLASIKVARGEFGDRILSMAEDGVYDGLSVSLSHDGLVYEVKDGVNHVTAGQLPEVSVTPIPAFRNARVTKVAASAVPDGNPNKEGTTAMTDAPAFTAEEGTALATKVTDLEAKVETLEKFKAEAPTAQGFQVNEEPIYRFHGTTPAPSGHDFAHDLYLAAIERDGAALKRLQEFTTKVYASEVPSFVDTGDTAQVNQPAYRPDLFLPQAPTPTSPMYDFFHKGALSDVTPFFYSKLDRAATDVAVHDHVEGVEPDPDDFVTVVGTTVTPTAVSGKVHITREVGDQGGNPQVSAMIWNEFDRSYKIALETKTVGLLLAAQASYSVLAAAPAAGANGAVAGLALEGGLIDLQFLPDGSRFVKGFLHRDLFKVLALHENAEEEKRYPIINPQNRAGIAGDKYSFLDVAGYRQNGIHSLGAASANSSWSFPAADPNALHVWNSGLQRLDKLGEEVEGWDIGVFGYFAGLVYDPTGIRKFGYDPAA